MINWNIEKQKRIYDLLLKCMYSEDKDYIQEQLSRIYTIIYGNNIQKTTNIKRLKEIK